MPRTSVPSTTAASRCCSSSSISSAARSIGSGSGGWCIASSVPCGAGVASTSASHVELAVGQVAVVVAGHAGVQGDDPQPVHLVHPVLGAVVVGAEEAARVRRPLVVVAHHPDHLGAHRLGRRLDDLAQPAVRRGLGLVGEVAGEDQRLRGRVDGREPCQGARPARPRCRRRRTGAAAGQQVRVGEVRDRVPGCRVLAELPHARRLGHAWGGSRSSARSPATFGRRSRAGRRRS